MNALESCQTNCPYCGEPIELLVDCSIEFQEYIEDCQVCCRPILCRVTIDEPGNPTLAVFTENE